VGNNSEYKEIVCPSGFTKTMIQRLGLWREPGPNIIKGAVKEEVDRILIAAPTYHHRDVKYILELENQNDSMEERVAMAGRIFGDGFIVKVLDQDNVLQEVLLACFKDMDYFRFARMSIKDFEIKYIELGI